MLEAIGQGDSRAADALLHEVYHQLRHLAAARLSHEKPGQTVQKPGRSCFNERLG